MIAYQTAVTTYKIVRSGKPSYIADKMKSREMSLNVRQGGGKVQQPGYTLNIAREGFIYRGASIFNKLEVSLRKETKLDTFKVRVKEWVKKNVDIKPTAHFSSIVTGNKNNRPTPPKSPPKPPPKPPPTANTITRYFVPRPKRVANEASTQPNTSTAHSSMSRNSIRRYFLPVNPVLPVSMPSMNTTSPCKPSYQRTCTAITLPAPGHGETEARVTRHNDVSLD